MKYFTLNQEIEDKIKSIKHDFFLSMNGVTSEQLSLAGVKYRTNYGVQWVRIKQIAEKYEQNILLAERLWNMDIREAKLIAPLLVPTNDMSFPMAEEWINDIKSQEIAETIAMSLLSKLPFSLELITKHITNENVFVRLAMVHTAARCAHKFSTENNKLILHSISQSDMEDIRFNLGISALSDYINLQNQ